MWLPKVRVLGPDGEIEVILWNGGMGAGISNHLLAGTLAYLGFGGVLSHVALDIIIGKLLGCKVSHFEAAKLEVEMAKRIACGRGPIYMNLMYMLHTFEESVRGAIAGGVDGLIVGAGLPLDLPGVVAEAKRSLEVKKDVALIPIVSSARAFGIICRKWRQNHDCLPDAVVLEGPLAGGHLGFRSLEELDKPEFQLEALLPDVLKVAKEYGEIPVVVAGGIWDRDDIIRFVHRGGASGVQIGTRFLATKESGASEAFKQAVISANKENIMVAENPGSPSGMLFRILADSPGYQWELRKERDLSQCRFGYMKHKDHCLANAGYEHFCICAGLWAAINGPPEKAVYTIGANAHRVDKILTVSEIVSELTGYSI